MPVPIPGNWGILGPCSAPRAGLWSRVPSVGPIPVKMPLLPAQLSGMCWRLQGKAKPIPHALVPFWCDSHRSSSHPGLHSCSQPCQVSTPFVGTWEGKGSTQGSSSTLPSLEGSHRRGRMSLHKYISCRGCGAQPGSASPSPCPHRGFSFLSGFLFHLPQLVTALVLSAATPRDLKVNSHETPLQRVRGAPKPFLV